MKNWVYSNMAFLFSYWGSFRMFYWAGCLQTDSKFPLRLDNYHIHQCLVDFYKYSRTFLDSLLLLTGEFKWWIDSTIEKLQTDRFCQKELSYRHRKQWEQLKS